MTEVFKNVGNFFLAESLEKIQSYPQWDHEDIDSVRHNLNELLEKRQPQIEEGMNDLENQYYWASYVLRQLGYCASVSEDPPTGSEADEDRPDFTLFFKADDFRRAVDYRGTRDFFSAVVAVARVVGWEASLDEFSTEDGTFNPAADVDRFLHATGVQWGMLTNGRVWRLFQRDTSGLMNTYFEMDLIEALKDEESFKTFFAIFSVHGLGGFGDAEPVAPKLLN